jgi:VanZ family protein
MNIVYLLVPLIWLDRLAAGEDSSRSYLTWILGIAGSVVIAGVYRYGLKQPTVLTSTWLAGAAAGWFVAASLPTFLNLGWWPLLGAVLAGVAVWIFVSLPVYGNSHLRRFELRVLKRLFPIYALYLLLLLLWPLPAELAHWRGHWGMAELPDDPTLIAALQLLEHFTAFTLLGYMVAESHGRRRESQKRSMAWTCLWCGLAAALLEVLRGFHPAHSASVASGLLMFVGSMYGSWIYWRHLSWIQGYLKEESMMKKGADRFKRSGAVKQKPAWEKEQENSESGGGRILLFRLPPPPFFPDVSPSRYRAAQPAGLTEEVGIASSRDYELPPA